MPRWKTTVKRKGSTDESQNGARGRRKTASLDRERSKQKGERTYAHLHLLRGES